MPRFRFFSVASGRNCGFYGVVLVLLLTSALAQPHDSESEAEIENTLHFSTELPMAEPISKASSVFVAGGTGPLGLEVGLEVDYLFILF